MSVDCRLQSSWGMTSAPSPKVDMSSTADPYDTTEAIHILIEDRAARYADDFVEAREVAAVALRDAVMRSAGAAGYCAREADGHYVISPQETTPAVVVLLANSDGLRVALWGHGELSDEAPAPLRYDPAMQAWVAAPTKTRKVDKADKSDTKEEAPTPEATRSPVAIVADLVVAALKKTESRSPQAPTPGPTSTARA